MEQFTRRDALQAVAAGTVVGLAGCQTGATDDLCGTEDPSTETTIPTEPLGSAPDLSSGSAWPTYQHDAGQTGFTDETGPTDGTRLAWSRSVGDGAAWPVAADETLVVSESGTGVLRALSPTDGSDEWSVDGFFGTTPPAVVSGLAVVGDRTGLHAFDLASGTERWTFEPEAEQTATEAQPTAAKETVVGTSDADSEETPAGARTTADFYSAPLSADGTILVKSSLGVHGLSPDGTERWRRKGAYLGAAADGTAYLLGASGMVAVGVQSGTEQWTREGIGIGPEMAVRDGTIYGGDTDSMTAIDAETGDTEWTFEGESEVFASPTVTPNVVLAASQPKESRDGGNLYALDRETGEPKWCTFLGFLAVDSPAVAGDTVFVTTDDVIEARELGSGDLRWRYGEESGSLHAPAVTDGRLVVGTEAGDVLTFVDD